MGHKNKKGPPTQIIIGSSSGSTGLPPPVASSLKEDEAGGALGTGAGAGLYRIGFDIKYVLAGILVNNI